MSKSLARGKLGIDPAFVRDNHQGQAGYCIIHFYCNLPEVLQIPLYNKYGLASVTLRSRKSGWEQPAMKAECLASFGEEYNLLKPILARSVTSFDVPKGIRKIPSLAEDRTPKSWKEWSGYCVRRTWMVDL
jgi:hypothetical protein